MNELIAGILLLSVVGYLFIKTLWRSIMIPKYTTVTYKTKSGDVPQFKTYSDNDMSIARKLKKDPNIVKFHVETQYWDDGWRSTYSEGDESIYDEPNF